MRGRDTTPRARGELVIGPETTGTETPPHLRALENGQAAAEGLWDHTQRAEHYARAMLRRRRWLLLVGAGLALVLLAISLVKGEWPAAAIFGVLLAINARGYLQR